MEIAARIDSVKYNAFRWRYESSVLKKLLLAFGMAALTGVAAQIAIPNPMMPDVPITGQTFAVLLAGVLLGRWWGGVSMVIYAVLGAVGVPWFAHIGTGGSLGYIIGFILAALFMGYFTDKYVRSRSFISMVLLMLFTNFVLIWVPGIIWLVMWSNLIVGKAASIAGAIAGSISFVPGDLVKLLLAASIAQGVMPKKAFGGEVDKDKWANWRIP